MGLFKEGEARPHLKRDALPLEFHLELHGLKMGTIEHCNLIKRPAICIEVDHDRCNELCLLKDIPERNKKGEFASSHHCMKVLRELPAVVGNAAVCEMKDLGC